MIVEKHDSIRRRKQTVSLMSFLFPSFFPSAFDLEAPLPLEDVGTRLEKLPRVRISREARLVHESLIPFPNISVENQTLSVAPFDFQLAYRDDTYMYRADLDDPRYRVSVVGYLKRWEAMSTVLTGRIYFNLHYVGVILKSLLYAAVIGIVSLVVSYILLFGGIGLYFVLSTNPAIFVAVWLVVLAALWLNDVVVPAHKGRERLVTRLEDMLLLAEG